MNLAERVYTRAQLEMGFKPRAISHGLNRAVSTVKREIGPTVRSDPHAAMMTADLELPVIRTETGGNAGSHIRPLRK